MAKTVLFLGAGFSYDFGLPIMSSFPDYVQNHPRLDDADRAFVRELQGHARRARTALNLEEQNLEAMLSVAVMRELLTPEDEAADSDSPYQTTSIKIRKLLKKICTPTGSSIRDKTIEYLDALDRVIGRDEYRRAAETGRLTTITTNYDIIFEFLSCIRMDRPFIPGITITHNNGEQPLYSKSPSGTTLCKLHGSTNWSEDKDGNINADDALTNGRIDFESHTLPRTWLSNSKDRDTDPLIIPPTLYKAEAHPGMRMMWEHAARSLANASRIVFIGFSFPDSDSYLKYFLGVSLNLNYNCSKIEIIDPRASSVVKRLQSKEYGLGDVVSEKLTPYDQSWMNCSIEPLFKST